MSKATHNFKRLVLGLQPSASTHGMRLAAELADLLRLDLLGLLLQDTSLDRLAGMPFAREFRPLGGGWHSIEPAQLSQDIDLAARSVRRMFTAATRDIATSYRFDVVHEPMADAIMSVTRSDDILVIIEPMSPAERVTQQFEQLVRDAFQSVAAVLFVPPQVVRTRGPIIVVAASPNDPSIRVAAAIAMAVKDELIILDVCGTPIDSNMIPNLEGEDEVAVKHVDAHEVMWSQPDPFLNRLMPFSERFIVATRGVFQNGDASTIAASRRVPVLIIEPTKVDRSQEPSGTAEE